MLLMRVVTARSTAPTALLLSTFLAVQNKFGVADVVDNSAPLGIEVDATV